MAKELEELKGRLLLLWFEDLKNDKEPGAYPEVKSLSQSDVEEVMTLARFIKGTISPSNGLTPDPQEYAKNITALVSEKILKEIESNKELVQTVQNFGELVRKTTNLLRIDTAILQDSLALPQSTLDELENGKLPPHRLPLEKMTKLLNALRLTFKEVIEIIRKSSLLWAYQEYSSSGTQLGRIDFTLKVGERREVMESHSDINRELERIEAYCSNLSTLLP
jgi:hypothetical protein